MAPNVQSTWLGVVQPGTGGTVQVVLNDVSYTKPLDDIFQITVYLSSDHGIV